MLANDPVLREFYAFFHQLGASDVEEQLTRDNVYGLVVNKGQQLIRAGELDNQLYWVHNGVLKISKLLDDGREFIKAFVSENNFYVAYASWLQKKPTEFYVEAVEDTTLIKLDFALIEAALQKSLRMNLAWRTYMDRHFLRHEQRELELLSVDAMHRYRLFAQNNPALAERIPQKCIARYLGITEQSLSRIRKQLKN